MNYFLQVSWKVKNCTEGSILKKKKISLQILADLFCLDCSSKWKETIKIRINVITENVIGAPRPACTYSYARGSFVAVNSPRNVCTTSSPSRNANRSIFVNNNPFLDVYLSIIRNEKYDAQLFISFAY